MPARPALVVLVVLLAAVGLALARRSAPVRDAVAAAPPALPAVAVRDGIPHPAASPSLVAGIQPEVLLHYQQEAARGDAVAEDNLASCYEQGLGVVADATQAVSWYRASADGGFSPAQFHLGSCYEHGTGVARDLEQARHWYRLASERGFTLAATALKRLDTGHG